MKFYVFINKPLAFFGYLRDMSNYKNSPATAICVLKQDVAATLLRAFCF